MCYKNVIYCCTPKYLKCIEYQVLRIRELNQVVKDNQEELKKIKSQKEYKRSLEGFVKGLKGN